MSLAERSSDRPEVGVVVSVGRFGRLDDRREPAAILAALWSDAVVVRPHPVLGRTGIVTSAHGVVELHHDTESGHVPRSPMSGPPRREPGLPGVNGRWQEPFGRFGESASSLSGRPSRRERHRGPGPRQTGRRYSGRGVGERSSSASGAEWSPHDSLRHRRKATP